jgi:hypothetical protein
MLKSLTLGLMAGGFLLAAPVASFADHHAEAEAAAPAEEVSCIDTRRIKTTKVVDNKTVIMRMRGGPDYQMNLVRRCPGLKMQKTIIYEPIPSGKLCSVDTIKVPITTGSGFSLTNVHHCAIDTFTVIEDEEDDSDKSATNDS